MVKHGVFEDLFDVLVCDFGRLLAGGAQVLSSIWREVDLCVSKVLGFIVGEQQDCSFALVTPRLS